MEGIINSKANQKIKLLKKLSLKKYREEFKLLKIENLTIIYDALKSGFDITNLFVTKEFIKKNKEKYEFLKNNSKVGEIFIIDETINKYYSELDTVSGITAIYDIDYGELEKNKSIIYLNGISDPGNVGTIIRTMIAFGIKNLVLDENCADIYNAKTISAARDAIFKVNIFKEKGKEWIKNCSLDIYVADSNNGKSLDKIKAGKEFCLVLGSESRGVDKEILGLAKESVRISISEDIESLNVAIAAGIIMRELRR